MMRHYDAERGPKVTRTTESINASGPLGVDNLARLYLPYCRKRSGEYLRTKVGRGDLLWTGATVGMFMCWPCAIICEHCVSPASFRGLVLLVKLTNVEAGEALKPNRTSNLYCRRGGGHALYIP